ncbi:MAG: response regulator [Deltaproteobacteria bacterium]|nr:response regulator [Deltaproteobacteria bacterium]
MNIYAFFSIMSSYVCLITGVFVYRRDTRNVVNRRFALLSITLAIYAFIEYGFCQSHSFEEAMVWRKFYSCWPFIITFVIHYAFFFTGVKRLSENKWFVALLYSFAFFFFIIEITTYKISGPPIEKWWGWTYSIGPSNAIAIAANLWMVLFIGFAVVLTTNAYRRTSDRQQRKQLRLVLVGLFVAGAAVVSESILFDLGLRAPPIATISLTIAFSIIGYGIWKYRLFALTPVTAAEDIIQTMTDALLLVNSIGDILYINRGAKDLLGYKEIEILKKSVKDIFPKEEDIPNWISESLSGDKKGEDEIHYFETSFLTKKRQRVPISLAGNALRDDEGELQGLLLIGRNITAQKRAEEETRDLERQFRQAQKAEAIGRLAGGVAHDINNILGAVMGAASALSVELSHDVPKTKDIDTILAACNRGRDLTQNLLGFARKGKYVREKVSLNKIVRETEALLGRTVSKKIVFKLELDDQLQRIEGDPGQLQHALMNVCINAIDSMAGQGSLTIATCNIGLKEEDIRDFPELEPGMYVEIKVIDSGTGMDEAILSKVFDPFFTTKPKGKGTGLGLSMVYGAIRNHDGAVRIDSRSEYGTTVVFLLPAIGRPSAFSRPETRRTPVKLTTNSGLILLVDDEPVIRNSSRRLLDLMGFEVLIAENGRKAIQIFKEQKSRVSLVILDLIMPEMDGHETYEALMEIDDRVRVLLCSGYTKDYKVETLLAKGARGFLQKPFDLQSLADKVGEALK